MKKLLSLALALMMVLSLAACGGKDGDTDAENGCDPAALESKTTKYAGDYRVSSMRAGGERYEYADLAAAGMADKVYLKINEDCTGVLNLGDGEIEIKVDDWNGISTADGSETLKFWEEGVTTLGIEDADSGVTVYFTTDPAPALGEFPLSFRDTYGGDWVGQGEFEGCTGDFSGNNGNICHGLARLVFDDIGNCTVFAGLGIGTDEKNLRDLTAAYNAERGSMALSGTFYGYPLAEESYIWYEEASGILHFNLLAQKDETSALHVIAAMRHPGDSWDYDNDPLALDPQYAELYAGIAFEELVAGFGLDVSRLPASASGSGSEPPVTPAAPSADYDTSGFDGQAKLYSEDLITVDYPTALFRDDGDGIGCDDPYLYLFAQTVLAPDSSSLAGCQEDLDNYSRDTDYSNVTDETILLGDHTARRVVAESWMGNIASYLIDLGGDGSDSAGWAFIHVKYEDAADLETAEAILSTIRAK